MKKKQKFKIAEVVTQHKQAQVQHQIGDAAILAELKIIVTANLRNQVRDNLHPNFKRYLR
jgi:hypothetical protein